MSRMVIGDVEAPTGGALAGALADLQALEALKPGALAHVFALLGVRIRARLAALAETNVERLKPEHLVRLLAQATAATRDAEDAGGEAPYVLGLLWAGALTNGDPFTAPALGVELLRFRTILQGEFERRTEAHPAGWAAVTLAHGMRSQEEADNLGDTAEGRDARERAEGTDGDRAAVELHGLAEEARAKLPPRARSLIAAFEQAGFVETGGEVPVTTDRVLPREDVLKLLADALAGSFDSLPARVAADVENEAKRHARRSERPAEALRVHEAPEPPDTAVLRREVLEAVERAEKLPSGATRRRRLTELRAALRGTSKPPRTRRPGR